MASSADLFSSNDNSLWRASLNTYSKVLALKEAEKKKKTKDDLVRLDKWYQETLPGLIASRKEPHITHAELSKLMKWKLTRGKFRPRLSELVQQNQIDEVEKVTKEAFQILPTNLEAAIKHLCQLKAVGPATASAILCAMSPQLVPFMADEAVLSVPGLGKMTYNLKHYMSYATKILDKVAQLNRSVGKSSVKAWTCHDAELALWAYHFAGKLGVELVVSKDEQQSLGAHSDAEHEAEGEDCNSTEEEMKPEPKRRKTKKT